MTTMRLQFRIAPPVLAFALGILVTTAHAGPLVVQLTDHTHGNTQLDSSHSYYWSVSYSGSTAFSPIAAIFTLKANSPTADAVLRLYEADATWANVDSDPGTPGIQPLAESSRGPNSVPAVTGSYTPIRFTLFNTPTVLPSRFNLTLTSATGTSGSEQYFIKGQIAHATFTFEDGNGNNVNIPPSFTYEGYNPGEPNGAAPTPPIPVPEPASFLGQAGLILAAVAYRRSRLKHRIR